jgi:hypothetical protein
MTNVKDRILKKESGLLFYGLTPPKIITSEEKIKIIAEKQIERLKGLNIDALVLYDIQDESSRTDFPRPFPFMPTLSPDYYSETYLDQLNIPKIIYKSVGKFTSDEFRCWVNQKQDLIECSVFVGNPSKQQASRLSLSEAYNITQESNSSILVGGVTIPERHLKKGDEHLRLFDKIDKGCSFFISQCVYSINNTKNFLSDYYYASLAENREMVPIIFTLTPCGSLKTLHFMEWLGIDIPQWLQNELKHSNDILSNSIAICKSIAVELLDYSKSKNIPIGFNIESVAIRIDEIEASIELVKDIKSTINMYK